MGALNLGVVDLCEAEAIFGAGLERCVDVIVGLAGERELFAARCECLEQRVARLEG